MMLSWADVVALLHVAFVAFVLLGFVVILACHLTGWAWTRDVRFRLIHGAAIAYTLVRTWLGARCPLATLEDALRAPADADGLIARVSHRMFFKGADHTQFTACVSVFAALVLAEVVWTFVRPRLSMRRDRACALR